MLTGMVDPLTQEDRMATSAAAKALTTLTQQTQESVRVQDLVWITGGEFLMGSDAHYPEEAPAHRVRVDGFWIDRYAVTNEDFALFVEATGHVTLAEETPNAAAYPGARPELLCPASVVFEQPDVIRDLRNPYSWWGYVPGAGWRPARRPDSAMEGVERHPVVHVAYRDALAYAQWKGQDLPTEAEWEFAARGGLEGAEFAWGVAFTPNGKFMANTWQGTFPNENLVNDGYEWTAPIGSFAPNGYGLYDMIG